MPRKLAVMAIAAVLITACVTHQYARRAEDALKTDNWDAAVYYYLEALARDPENVSLKMNLQRTRLKAGEFHFRQGLRFKEAGDLQRARSEFELAVQLDPTHQYAGVELAKVKKDLAILAEKGGAAKLEAMKKEAAEMKVKPPTLNPASNEPITLSFPNPTNVKDIYKAIGQAFGINIMFDPKLKDAKIAIELKDVTAQQALENVMQAAGHFYKVLDPKTIIVVEDTPQNRRDYEDLVVKTFFLSNAEVKDINNMLRALIDARRIAINEQLNSIVLRDTADKVAIAERLINVNDKAKAEVLVDVELLQVDSTKIRDIGTSLSSYAFPVTMDPTSITGDATKNRIPLGQLGDITRSMWGVVVPNLTINLVKSAGEAETLAQPELRITEGEKASLIIGDKVPIPTTTFNTTQTIGGNIVPITSFQYTDVGIKVDVEPRVHHNNEVTLKLQVEVSQLGDQVDIGGGQKQYKIGTRTINSVIRLKDGETSLLAGLYKYNKSKSRSGVPFLSDIPVIGALFRDNSSTVTKTDLILTLTPHIIRTPDITEEDLAPIWVGTENRITVFGNSPRVRSSAAGSPFGEGGPQFGPGVGARPSEGEAPGEGGAEQQPGGTPEGETPQTRTVTLPDGRTIEVPRHFRRNPNPRGGGDAPGQAGSGSSAGTDAAMGAAQAPATDATAPAADAIRSTSTAPTDDLQTASAEGLSTLTFYPARVPVVLGNEARVTVVLDAGYAGVTGPLHLAYDPTRLEVTEVEGGDLQVEGGNARVRPTHTPALGWITANWEGTALGSGTLVSLTVRPRQAGEVPLIFAGPVGVVTSRPATIVGLPPSVPRVNSVEQE
jgi:general secretion pathway protein D